MNRLATRVTLAMILVACLSLVAVPLATALAERWVKASLPEDFRERLEVSTAPAPLRAGPGGPVPTPGRRLGGEDVTPEDLQRDLEQLVSYVGAVRSARQTAVYAGVGAAVLVSVVLALRLSRGIARPIEAVTRAASAIAAGAYGTRAALGEGEVRSVTVETRQLLEHFDTMSLALERFEEERRAMIADIAHELRTPLAALLLRLEAIADGLVPFEQGEAELLLQQGQLLSRLVDDLRLLSLADAGRLTLDRQDLDLTGWLPAAVEALRPGADAKGVELRVTTTPAEAVVSADPQRLAQLLGNLVDNALRFSEPGSAIDVTLDVEGDEAVLSVRDRGPGLAEEDLDTVFERFNRGKRRDMGAQHSAGSGLGLAIVRTLVTLHGGSVSVKNVTPGAEFSVRLPLGQESKG